MQLTLKTKSGKHVRTWHIREVYAEDLLKYMNGFWNGYVELTTFDKKIMKEDLKDIFPKKRKTKTQESQS